MEVGIHGRLHERSVAEELRRQKEQQEQADRGGCGLQLVYHHDVIVC